MGYAPGNGPFLKGFLVLAQGFAQPLQFKGVQAARRIEQNEVGPTALNAHRLQLRGRPDVAMLAGRKVRPSPVRPREAPQDVRDAHMEGYFFRPGGRRFARAHTAACSEDEQRGQRQCPRLPPLGKASAMSKARTIVAATIS